jgi:Tol biopolymer transport system component
LIYFISMRAASAPDSTAGIHIIDTQTGDQRALIREDSKMTFGSYPIWSPNGRTIAFMSDEAGTSGSICVVEIDGTNFRQVTHLDGWCTDLQWSADGQRIYFHFTPSPATLGDPSVTRSWVVNSDGTGLHPLAVDLGDPRVHFWFQFSIGPGDRVAYSGLDPTGAGGVIWTMNIDGSDRRQVTVP